MLAKPRLVIAAAVEPGLWNGARKIPKRSRWLMGTVLRLMEAGSASMPEKANGAQTS
jgi:hypothetical protein